MIAAAAGIVTAAWLYWIGAAAAKEIIEALRKRQRLHGGWRTRLLDRPFRRLLGITERWELVQQRVEKLHRQRTVLNGVSWSMDQTKAEVSAALGQAYCAFVASVWLSWLAGESMLSAMGAVIAIVLVLRRFIEAGREVERRRRAIIAALPDMLARLMLLVGAGETVQGAFAKSLEGKENSAHPLHKEWRHTVMAMKNGQSFGTAIERFNRSCAIQEAAVFTTVVLLNYHRGGDQFVLALREFSYSLWEKRKAAARTSGEEASSKLVFPLVGILFIMMVIVAAPAFMLMS
ncbi:type II secretion system F family protein [Paenibacillus sp. LHD-117]|uniref:type II secretion system F family protein n=1 Tax=Paenibacillus sp. LHD-117 TaxID=3071412 RepID=UPI0027E130FB|nr:type II secretion system F family protein [Paenibacillus sp. LHD-117]MDQ6420323.1 type II secretion system F family protein [Paenibacillus sp. LHD-117]